MPACPNLVEAVKYFEFVILDVEPAADIARYHRSTPARPLIGRSSGQSVGMYQTWSRAEPLETQEKDILAAFSSFSARSG
jgi:hypothetical protein